jgi:hypothetical protein
VYSFDLLLLVSMCDASADAPTNNFVHPSKAKGRCGGQAHVGSCTRPLGPLIHTKALKAWEASV